MGTKELRTEMVDALSKVSRKLRTLFDGRVREQGLTLARARTLLVLSNQEGLYQKELAEVLEIENATMVRLLDGLERQNFIERRAVKGDRRAKQIVMTHEGREQAELVVKLAEEVRQDLLDTVSDEDIAATVRVLHAMGHSMEKTDRPPLSQVN
ncbi:MarR family transcriptional regulator [Phyllobacterium phragmitis]|uniref:MarR family transcriptional regulator n=1 Tax=Phyllobacterium phragmitis TaxID=2670329 RepID=A0A2S9ITN3_9HYPH|nr:MarR family transcriptional regulator [Phyllobacterium phragmitis]PRD43878.1 MarR family transcriptional regulator [Phyllobacterium phragmitis]